MQNGEPVFVRLRLLVGRASVWVFDVFRILSFSLVFMLLFCPWMWWWAILVSRRCARLWIFMRHLRSSKTGENVLKNCWPLRIVKENGETKQSFILEDGACSALGWHFDTWIFILEFSRWLEVCFEGGASVLDLEIRIGSVRLIHIDNGWGECSVRQWKKGTSRFLLTGQFKYPRNHQELSTV